MVVILGGGLTGLSTAYHLGDVPHVVLEAAEEPGGLCRTRELSGFHFDHTGHLLHLRDPRIVRFVDELLPGALRLIERRAAIRTQGVTLPFPFQANLHGLPAEQVAECLIGFVEAMGKPVADAHDASFAEWSLSVLGRGISERFMFPYNTKLFRREPAEMTADWVAWAVPRPSLAQVVRGALGIVNAGLGYNPSFRYPASGGIGVLPRALAARVDHLRCGAEVTGVDLDRRRVTLGDGSAPAYDVLVVTIPLPIFLGLAGMEQQAQRLDWSVVACLNLGVARPEIAGGVHWIYFPDADAPFYRVGFPTNFSSGVAPHGTSSLYVEFGLRRGEPLDRRGLEAAALAALYREGILDRADRILVRDWLRIDPGYVIFDRARQAVMAEVVPALERRDVHLAGRYGAWTYSYMERALIDGLELATRIRAGSCQRA